MDHQVKEARRVVEGLRLYRRGLRQIETGERSAARKTAADIAHLCLDEMHGQNIEWLASSLPTATEADAAQAATRAEEALNVLRRIMEDGRDEEARHVERLANDAPWYRRSEIKQQAETRLAEFVSMVREVVDIYCEAEVQTGLAALLAKEAAA